MYTKNYKINIIKTYGISILDIRTYVKDVIMNLVLVHAQVFAVSSDLLPQVLSALTDLLADEFKRLLEKEGQSKRKFMSAGAVTVRIHDLHNWLPLISIFLLKT